MISVLVRVEEEGIENNDYKNESDFEKQKMTVQVKVDSD